MSLLQEALFVVTHPRASLEAKLRQKEFPELPISEAAALIGAARRKENFGGGVQLEDWSKADQERMLRGERPEGIPIHRNL